VGYIQTRVHTPVGCRIALRCTTLKSPATPTFGLGTRGIQPRTSGNQGREDADLGKRAGTTTTH